MAELNFGLLTPPGSQSVGNAFVSGMDQAAAARAQENQNALSQYTLGKAKREDELTNQLLGDLRVATTPEEIYRAYQRVGKPDIALKMQSERLTQDKLRGDILAQPGDRAYKIAQTEKLQDEARKKVIGEVAGFPDAESAHAAIDYRLSNNLIDKPTADRLRQGLTPENFPKWKLETLTRMLTPSEQLTQSALKHVDTDRGGYIGRQYFDAQGNPSGMEQKLEKTVSPNTTATIDATRRNHLENLAQQGWTFDTERGIGVNARLGLSKPISTLMSQTGGPLAAPVGGAPAVQSGVPMVAPTGVPGQRQAPAGQAPAGQPVGGPNVLGPKPADTQKTEIELNKQYTSESKGFIETKLAIDKAKAALRDAATNPTAGLSAGTAFMKILDPASVVRETELAMALKSSGWFDRVTNIANTLQSGKTILTPTQITNLNKTIDGLFEEVKAEQRIVDSGYARRAKSYGLDVRNIITDRGQNKIGITEQTPPNAPPIQSFRPKL